MVLTAAHVVAGAAAAGITVRGPDKMPHPARVVDGLTGDPDTVDLALLELRDEIAELPGPPLIAAPQQIPHPPATLALLQDWWAAWRQGRSAGARHDPGWSSQQRDDVGGEGRGAQVRVGAGHSTGRRHEPFFDSHGCFGRQADREMPQLLDMIVGAVGFRPRPFLLHHHAGCLRLRGRPKRAANAGIGSFKTANTRRDSSACRISAVRSRS